MAWLDDQFALAWDAGVFARFTDSVTWWIGGEPNNTLALQADVDWGEEQGTNEAAGEGRATVDMSGEPLLRNVKLEVPAAVAARLRPDRDCFELAGGELVVVSERPTLGRDGATATVICRRQEGATRKLARPRV